MQQAISYPDNQNHREDEPLEEEEDIAVEVGDDSLEATVEELVMVIVSLVDTVNKEAVVTQHLEAVDMVNLEVVPMETRDLVVRTVNNVLIVEMIPPELHLNVVAIANRTHLETEKDKDHALRDHHMVVMDSVDDLQEGIVETVVLVDQHLLGIRVHHVFRETTANIDIC